MTKTTLITGGGSGIGRGIALGLARRGMDIVLVGRQQALLEETASLAGKFGVSALSLACDLTQPAQRASLVEQVHARVGEIDILVNNAGVLHGGGLDRLDLTQINESVTLNLLAAIDLLRLFQADLATRQGTVAFISSSVSQVPLPYLSLYSASKAGIDTFARSVQFELQRQGIHTVIAYPPTTATAMTDAMAAATPWFRRADPLVVGEQIATGILAQRCVVDLQGGERVLAWVNRVTPGLVRRVLAGQARRFERMG